MSYTLSHLVMGNYAFEEMGSVSFSIQELRAKLNSPNMMNEFFQNPRSGCSPRAINVSVSVWLW